MARETIRDIIKNLPKEKLINLVIELYEQIDEEKKRSYCLEKQILDIDLLKSVIRHYEQRYNEEQKEKP